MATFCSYHLTHYLIQTETPGFPRSSNSSTKAAVIWGGFMQWQLVWHGHSVQGFTQQQPPTMAVKWFPFIVNVLPASDSCKHVKLSGYDASNEHHYKPIPDHRKEITTSLFSELSFALQLTVGLQYHNNYLPGVCTSTFLLNTDIVLPWANLLCYGSWE